MPIYEYLCLTCKKRFSYLIGVVADPGPLKCPRCGEEKNLKKLISRVSRLRDEDEIFESLTDEAALSGIDENDPRSVASFMRKLSKEMGEEGEDMEELIEAVESGEDLEGENLETSEELPTET
ncbi:zinc ribbon domain-containing protein [bacterium]|nr:zinc ribbon domain-containing protein [bacterium]